MERGVAAPSNKTKEQNDHMKTIAGLIVAGLMLVGAGTLSAQNTQTNGQGKGYGGPPQSEQERLARQAACLEKNNGVCPQGGPRQDCPKLGQGKGKGACDGIGPKRQGGGQGSRGGRK